MNSNRPTLSELRTASSADIDALNSLLRGEMSAVETYDQAHGKFTNRPVLLELNRIRDEHRDSVSVLRGKVRDCGGEPSESSGPWGTFAQAVTGTAKVMGPVSVLATLKQGEEHGISDYEKILHDDDVAEDCKDLIQAVLLPKCRLHVLSLDRSIAAIETVS